MAIYDTIHMHAVLEYTKGMHMYSHSFISLNKSNLKIKRKLKEV